MRKCTKCGEGKPPEAYGKHQVTADGLRPQCKECTKVKDAEYRAANKAKAKAYREQHREKARAYHKVWRAENRDHSRVRSTRYTLNRRRTDPAFALVCRLRWRIRSALKHTNRSGRFWDLTGCSRQELFAHIESQFSDGMSWENMPLWHVDHIKPCAVFDLTDPDQQRECFHFTNLQPLWARDNFAKGSKYFSQEQAA
jgi:hypothetical protein